MNQKFIPLRQLRKRQRRLSTPILDGLRKQGLDIFLYFDELTAVNRDGGPIPADYIRENKETLIAELKSLTAPGEKISFDVFLEDRRR